MKYYSTRGKVDDLQFEEAVMMGLADDGGLLVPNVFPQIQDQLSRWRTLDFQDLCLEIMSLFTMDQISREELQQMIQKSYSTFRQAEITPVKQVGNLHILELFHGPTFAFKDVALQFLGNLFEHFLAKRNHPLRIIGATSGDTGSAAIHGMRGKKGVDVFMLHPKGRVSPIQERQMTTVLDENIHNIAVEGSFDDAQSIVKSLFNDAELKKSMHLGAVNSINWARILVQIVYYFYAWFRVSENEKQKVNFVVPTGNFGNILAGYYAKRMGLPINKLVVGTNENDILHRFFSKGEYHQTGVKETWSPSMDIQISSNFERFLFHLADESASQVCAWMNEFEETGRLTISGKLLEKAQQQFASANVNDDEIMETIQRIFQQENYLLDPHTAVGVRAAEKQNLEGPVICLACAHPAKFGEAVKQATSEEVELPVQLSQLESMETRCQVTSADSEAVRQVMLETLKS